MKKIFIAILAIAAVSLTSCNNWLDINNNPNSVSTVDNGLIMPAAEINLLTCYSFNHVMGSFFSEQWAQKTGGPNTMAFSQWNTQDGGTCASLSNRIYSYSYNKILNNVEAIRVNSKDSEGKITNAGDYLAATVVRCFTFHMLADMFGEIPYTEALDPSITSPKYDDGKTVYSGILAELNEALSQDFSGAKSCDNIIFGGDSDVNNWIMFGNALKLRILMRQNAVANSKSELDALVAEGNFPKRDIAYTSFSDEAGKDNPVYDNFVRAIGDNTARRSQDISAHMAVLGTMNSYNDPRVSAKFRPSVKYGIYEGNFIDSQQSIEKGAGYCDENTFSEPELTYNTPVYLITVSEVNFLLAEYYATIANTPDKAEAYYKAAIDASCEQCKVTGAENIYASGSPYAWNAAKAAELIGVQKWIALTGVNGFESWCEIRRTGYPAFGEYTGKQIYTTWVELADENIAASKKNPTPLCEDLVNAGVYSYGTIFTPSKAEDIANNLMLQRFRYPSSSNTTNANIPAQKGKGDKMFWSK